MAGHVPVAPDGFWRDAIERVRRLPDVEAASLARVPPGGWEGIGLGGIDVTDRPGRLSGFTPSWNIVAPGYFAALRIPMVNGRDFSAADTAQSPRVIVIAAGLARRCWPAEDAVGKYLMLSTFNPGTSRWEKRSAVVVGVVGDIKSSSLVDGLAEPFVYLPVAQVGNTDFIKTMTIVTRSRNTGIRLQAQVERAIREIDPDLVASESSSLADAIKFGLVPQRVLATATGVLGLAGLLLASIGVYGVMAYTVAQRRREFGIRIALGAPPAAIVWIVLRQGAWIVTAGCVIGLALTAVIGQGLSVFLYGLHVAHAATFLVTVSVVAIVSGAACYLPARHAVGLEPLRALDDLAR
jgi:putative ABC transport system permease protein